MQDLLRRRGFILVSWCPLCYMESETTDHVLWNCGFAAQVWSTMLPLCNLNASSGKTLYEAVTNFLQVFKNRRTPSSLQRRASYMLSGVIDSLWAERNKRLFDDSHLPKSASLISREIVYGGRLALVE